MCSMREEDVFFLFFLYECNEMIEFLPSNVYCINCHLADNSPKSVAVYLLSIRTKRSTNHKK